MKIRVVKTGSGASAVQVIRYQNNKRIIVRHFGSAHNEQELKELKFSAKEWLKDSSGQLPIFPEDDPNQLLLVNKSKFIGVHYAFYYDTICHLQRDFGFDDTIDSILKDLVIVRLFEPASKVQSLELIKQYFGIEHQRKVYYKIAPQWLDLKGKIETKVIEFAKKNYSFQYDILFYDVTTLYFETFTEDNLREKGFSKDNKSQQPQILIGLIVSKKGFPITYEIFSGSTFEGNTIIPVINSFIKKNQVKEFTVIADAAMISRENISKLKENKIHYIVGARLANLSKELIDQIDKQIIREDDKSIRLKTDNGYLVCNYSSKRFSKDKYEMDKQIEKAQSVIEQPSKNKKLKFTVSNGEKLELNNPLIEKVKKLLGIKGYYTDLEENVVDNQTIIDRYHELYRIEQAFRISKNDLEVRPIFHYKEEPIKLHLLICFMALVIAKHVELKTNISIRKFIQECKKIQDGRILNLITNKEIKMKGLVDDYMKELLVKLGAPH